MLLGISIFGMYNNKQRFIKKALGIFLRVLEHNSSLTDFDEMSKKHG